MVETLHRELSFAPEDELEAILTSPNAMEVPRELIDTSIGLLTHTYDIPDQAVRKAEQSRYFIVNLQDPEILNREAQYFVKALTGKSIFGLSAGSRAREIIDAYNRGRQILGEYDESENTLWKRQQKLTCSGGLCMPISNNRAVVYYEPQSLGGTNQEHEILHVMGLMGMTEMGFRNGNNGEIVDEVHVQLLALGANYPLMVGSGEAMVGYIPDRLDQSGGLYALGKLRKFMEANNQPMDLTDFASRYFDASRSPANKRLSLRNEIMGRVHPDKVQDADGYLTRRLRI